MAQVESTQVEKEQLAAMYKMVRLQQEANLEQTKRDLKDQINKRKQIEALQSELKAKGVKTFGITGVLAFPRSERIVETAIEAANKIRGPLASLIFIVFFCRLIYYQFGFSGVNKMGDLVRDVIICSFLLMIYPELVRGILRVSTEIAGQIGESRLQDLQPKELKLPILESVATSTKLFAIWLFEWIKYSAYAVIEFAMKFGLAFMVLLFPIVIFVSQMMNFAVAWPIFLGSFVAISLWPLFWNLVGLAATLSWGQAQKTFSESLYSVFLTLIQLVSPLVGIKLLSGQNISRSLSEAANTIVNPASQLLNRMSGDKENRKQEKDSRSQYQNTRGDGDYSQGRKMNGESKSSVSLDDEWPEDLGWENNPRSYKYQLMKQLAAEQKSQNETEGTLSGGEAFRRGFKGNPLQNKSENDSVPKEKDK